MIPIAMISGGHIDIVTISVAIPRIENESQAAWASLKSLWNHNFRPPQRRWTLSCTLQTSACGVWASVQCARNFETPIATVLALSFGWCTHSAVLVERQAGGTGTVKLAAKDSAGEQFWRTQSFYRLSTYIPTFRSFTNKIYALLLSCSDSFGSGSTLRKYTNEYQKLGFVGFGGENIVVSIRQESSFLFAYVYSTDGGVATGGSTETTQPPGL